MAMEVKVAIGLVAVFVLWAVFRTPSPEDQEKSRRRAAIELCWENQKKKSNTADMAVFIAGACEKMESEFMTKYGRKP